MKSLTVRLPDDLVAHIENEARKRNMSKSDIVRERLSSSKKETAGADPKWRDVLAKVVGSVDGLPRDMSANTKAYLRATGYGRKRPR